MTRWISGVAYQQRGRMDLAEPWYRRAITDGHGLVAVHTTEAREAGHTVEEIACQNLRLAIPAGTPSGGDATCPSTLTLDVAQATQTTCYTAAPQSSFNTYFAFDKSELNTDGLANVAAAAASVLADPARRVSSSAKRPISAATPTTWAGRTAAPSRSGRRSSPMGCRHRGSTCNGSARTIRPCQRRPAFANRSTAWSKTWFTERPDRLAACRYRSGS